MFKSLLVAIDGSELGNKALSAAIELARVHGGKLVILTATDPVATGIGSGGFGTIDAGAIVMRLEENYAAQAKALLDTARQSAEAAGIAAEAVHAARQSAADAILSVATEKGCDTIVMGSHGRRGLGRLILGSQAAEVLARSSLPVLVVK